MSLRDDLKAFVDGELSPERAKELKAALQTDPVLAQEAEELRHLSTEIQAFAAVPTPVGLENALRAIRPRRPWWSPLSRTGQFTWGATATAAVLVAVMLYLPKNTGIVSDAARYETAALKSPTNERTSVESSAADLAPRKLSQPAPGGESSAPEAAPKSMSAGGAAYGLDEAASKTAEESVLPPPVPARKQDLRLSLKVADPEQAEAEVVAMAGPLGGSAQVDQDKVILTVPQGRTDEAMRELRKIGRIETQGEAQETYRASSKDETKGPAVTQIEAKIEATPRTQQPTRSDEPGPSPIFWGLLGLIGLAGAGVLWSIRRRV